MSNEPVAWIAVGDNTSVFFDLDCALSIDDSPIPLYTHPVKELTETDLILILEVLIDSYDDTNRGFLEYKAMYKNSPMRKARIDGMKRMVDKHTHAIEIVEAILRKAQE
jgi:hypothetical protein